MASLRFRHALACVGLCVLASTASAQGGDYPSRPIRIIVPFAGGSGSDSAARFFAEKMEPYLGQPVIVENKPGADGAIGMMAAKSSPADGYTIVQGGISPSVVNAVVNKELGYDPVKDFKPLLGYGRNMNVVLVSNDSKLRSFADFLKAAKTSPAPLNVGTFSTTLALTAAWLGNLAGTTFNNIPYKGQAAIMTDVIGNQLDFALVDLGGASALLRAGKLRALAVSGENRSPDFPDVPTIKESGLSEYVQYSWNAMYVRTETPDAIRDKLSEAIRKVMTSEDTVRNYYRPRGTEGIPLTPVQMQKLQHDEIERFRRIAKAANFESR